MNLGWKYENTEPTSLARSSSVSADEVTDSSNKTQMTIVLRYVNKITEGSMKLERNFSSFLLFPIFLKVFFIDNFFPSYLNKRACHFLFYFFS